MAEVIWSPEARADLHEIADYIAKDSLHDAGATVSRITASVERLKKFPSSGRIVSELGMSTVREIVLGSYRIVYRLSERYCEIVTARLVETFI
ncbi:MAG: type II toxin-antitoxin system RelE/ParE family toxin [Ignavibacteria bacterium]|nr:type II toxin-antitoxin system RelE/ParE family toxin [Ignavibacteria bacterium]MBI3764932.1 type II toxin-antitoxin system RelE/ParE family toxin [Ignavibacteriales bacterium]